MNKFIQSIVEAIVLVAVAATVGLAVNGMREDGLDLRRNHFGYASKRPAPATAPATSPPVSPAGRESSDSPAQPSDATASDAGDGSDASGSSQPPESPDHTSGLSKKLANAGLAGISLEETYKYFQVGDSTILLVDARSDDHYREGHIPGAVQFYPYTIEKHLDNVKLFVGIAQTIIVYCGGGDCEDSINAAFYFTTEMSDPFPAERVFVFEGGMTAWKDAGYPVVTGDTSEGDQR